MKITDSLHAKGGFYPFGTIALLDLVFLEYDGSLNITTIFYLHIGLMSFGLYWVGE